MINPKKELFKWGPIDGRPIYVDPFVVAFKHFPNVFNVSWPEIIGYFEDDKVVFVSEYGKLRNRGEALFNNYILDDKKLEINYSKWIETTKEIHKYENLVNEQGKLKKFSEEELLKTYQSWLKDHLQFWVYGFLPELSNWGGEQILIRGIKEHLKGDDKDFIQIFEGLSAPEDLSFFQTEKLDLLNVKLGNGTLDKHQKKYYWIKNSYGFTEVLENNYFKKILNKTKNPLEKITEITNYPNKIKWKKQELIKKFNIPNELVEISKKICYCVNWQDYRKKFIFIANHINTRFIEEISERRSISFKELCYYVPEEIINLLSTGKEIDTKIRFNGFAMYYFEKGELVYVSGPGSNKLIFPYTELEIDPEQKVLTGIVVSRGNTVKGKVALIDSPRNLDWMKKGDILVTPMTSPDYIIIMRMASAIITDEGGMTSHAAIVSRELGIPCIVGTTIATKLLKNGEEIEVDTKQGKITRMNPV